MLQPPTSLQSSQSTQRLSQSHQTTTILSSHSLEPEINKAHLEVTPTTVIKSIKPSKTSSEDHLEATMPCKLLNSMITSIRLRLNQFTTSLIPQVTFLTISQMQMLVQYFHQFLASHNPSAASWESEVTEIHHILPSTDNMSNALQRSLKSLELGKEKARIRSKVTMDRNQKSLQASS